MQLFSNKPLLLDFGCLPRKSSSLENFRPTYKHIVNKKSFANWEMRLSIATIGVVGYKLKLASFTFCPTKINKQT